MFGPYKPSAVKVSVVASKSSSTTRTLIIRGINFGPLQVEDYVPVSLVSPRLKKVFRFHAVHDSDNGSSSEESSPVVILSKNIYEDLIKFGKSENWTLIATQPLECRVEVARQIEVNHRQDLIAASIPVSRIAKKTRSSFVMASATYVSGPVRLRRVPIWSKFTFGDDSEDEVVIRAPLSLRVALGLETKSHYDIDVLNSDHGSVDGLVASHDTKSLRITSFRSWSRSSIFFAQLRSAEIQIAEKFLVSISTLISAAIELPNRFRQSVTNVLSFVIGGPVVIARTGSGEPVVDGHALLTLPSERLQMLALPEGGAVDLIAGPNSFTATAISLGVGQQRIAEVAKPAATAIGVTRGAPVGPLARPFMTKVGLATRLRLQIPMNSIVYLRRNPWSVIARGFARVTLPLLALLVSIMGLSMESGKFDAFGKKVPIWWIVAAALFMVLTALLSLRKPRGKV